MKNIKSLMILLYTLCISSISYADVITGEIIFDKRPSKAGVFYEYKDDFSKINGEINQKNKKFVEKVGVASHLGSLELYNNDEFEHNIFANDIKHNIKFDIGLMSPGSNISLQTDWQPNTLVRIGCKIHPKMRSYIANIPSDNFVSFEFNKKQKQVPIELKNISKSAKRFVFLLAGMENTEIILLKGETKSFDVIKKGKKAGTITLTRA